MQTETTHAETYNANGTQPDTLKADILAALRKFARQRPGLEGLNYRDARGNFDRQSYGVDIRGITRDLKEAEILLRQVELVPSITGQDLITASRLSFSGRLKITETPDGITLDYCTGQYFPTEYRRAVAAICAGALWDWVREKAMPEPKYKTHGTPAKSTRHPGYPDAPLHTVETYDGLSGGDWLRRYFRREFGRGIASRFFN